MSLCERRASGSAGAGGSASLVNGGRAGARLQRAHVERLIAIVSPDQAAPAAGPSGGPGGPGGGQAQQPNLSAFDVVPLARAQRVDLRGQAIAAAARTQETGARAHLRDVAERIDRALRAMPG